jgi:hypothetical protein
MPPNRSGLSHKARKRWSLVILLVGLPLYIAVAVTVMNWLGRPPLWVELFVYVALGVVWALPFRLVFRGVGKADPADTPEEPGPGPK